MKACRTPPISSLFTWGGKPLPGLIVRESRGDLANDVRGGDHLPGLELGGATWPGVPVFWTGTNLDTAWGQVALHASSSDLYMEMLHPTDSHRYDRNGTWLDAARRSERTR